MPFTPVIGTGFELGTTPPYALGGSEIIAGGVGGAYCAYHHTYNYPVIASYIYVNVPGTLSEAYCAMWLKPTGSAYFDGIRVGLSTGHYIDLRTPNNGYYNLFVNGVQVANGTIPSTIGAWTHIQIHVIIADAGLVETKINGYADITYNGDTQPAGAATINLFGNVCQPPNNNNNYTYGDNLVVGTGGWPGDFRFEALMPNADTATAQLTPTPAGTHYTTLNERGPSDSTYVLGETNGLRDIYDLSNWTDTEKIPVYLIQHMRAYKSNAGTQQVKFIAVLDGTEDVGTPIIITTAPLNYYRNLLLAPDGTAWDTTKINALQIGAEVVF